MPCSVSSPGHRLSLTLGKGPLGLSLEVAGGEKWRLQVPLDVNLTGALGAVATLVQERAGACGRGERDPRDRSDRTGLTFTPPSTAWQCRGQQHLLHRRPSRALPPHCRLLQTICNCHGRQVTLCILSEVCSLKRPNLPAGTPIHEWTAPPQVLCGYPQQFLNRPLIWPFRFSTVSAWKTVSQTHFLFLPGTSPDAISLPPLPVAM